MKNKKSSADLLGVAVTAASHIMIVLGLNLMVLLIIDTFFNQAMNFLGNYFFKLGSMLFIVCGIFLALVSLFREGTDSGAGTKAASKSDSDAYCSGGTDRQFRKH
ncbi:MAG: hypothetical protein E7554_08370 [Ruminococcaceae bacterium]|nr:hypothetical protein [Oscillospiraceae bacterium]